MSEKGLYGIPFPHWDIIARIVPGFLFLTVVWAVVLDVNTANAIWNTLDEKHPWYYWIGVFLFSYMVGHAVDPATLGLTNCAARHHQKKENKKRKRDLKWEVVFDYYTTKGRNKPEGTSIDKAQVESRSLTNMGCLVLVAVILAIVANWGYRVNSMWKQGLGAYYSHLISLLVVLALFLMWGGFKRQGRRVYGVNAIYDALGSLG